MRRLSVLAAALCLAGCGGGGGGDAFNIPTSNRDKAVGYWVGQGTTSDLGAVPQFWTWYLHVGNTDHPDSYTTGSPTISVGWGNFTDETHFTFYNAVPGQTDYPRLTGTLIANSTASKMHFSGTAQYSPTSPFYAVEIDLDRVTP